jgi:hypothetical protein
MTAFTIGFAMGVVGAIDSTLEREISPVVTKVIKISAISLIAFEVLAFVGALFAAAAIFEVSLAFSAICAAVLLGALGAWVGIFAVKFFKELFRTT